MKVAETEKKNNEEVLEEKKTKKASKKSKEAELQAQLDEKNDLYLRLAAEYDNFRKRSQKEKESAYSDSKAKVLEEFLPVIDNFERAAMNSQASLEDYKKGVEMIFGQFDSVFKKLGVEAFGEAGEEFDPNMHSAVMHIDDETLGENIIAEVFSKGYKMGDRILRFAVVKVAN
ncbi:MAG: nucleotide exchange factor GrpE [Clostridia bacterium]|nr:nucleotide exchange factor GrpE [Clostridia bacterium]